MKKWSKIEIKFSKFIFVFLSIFVSIMLLFNFVSATTITYDLNTSSNGLTSTNGQYTWTVPSGIYNVAVEVWGAGGSSGCIVQTKGGGGGGGGGYAYGVYNVTPGNTYSIVVGAKGSGVNRTGGDHGGAGGSSSFGNLIYAVGGGGGYELNGGNYIGAPGGAGGNGYGQVNIIGYDGLSIVPPINNQTGFQDGGAGGNGGVGGNCSVDKSLPNPYTNAQSPGGGSACCFPPGSTMSQGTSAADGRVVLNYPIIMPPVVQPGCEIQNQTILTLYSENNSHAAVFNSTYNDPNYGVPICYDTLFGHEYTGDNPWNCTGNNSIINLYSSTNSHASNQTIIFGGVPFYTTNVCYGDLSCTVRYGSCNTDNNETTILSLSDWTNAHLAKGDFSPYLYKVCCQAGTPVVVTPPAVANITDAWFVNLTTGGGYNIVFQNNSGFGKQYNVSLYGKTLNIDANESLLPMIMRYNDSTNVWNYTNLLIDDLGDAQSDIFNFADNDQLNSSFQIGDWVYFNLNYNYSQPENITKQSYIAQILNGTDVAPYVTTDCTQFNNTNQSNCESYMINSNDPNVVPWAPVNATCDGNRINRCSWNNATSTCEAREEVYKLDQFQGSCITSYDSINNTCVNGYRTATVHVTSIPGSCTTATLCDQNSYIQIPCRNVALLPFFDLTNMIIVLLVVVVVYIFMINTKNKRRNK